jgi:hypothetical protein
MFTGHAKAIGRISIILSLFCGRQVWNLSSLILPLLHVNAKVDYCNFKSLGMGIVREIG